MKSTWTNHLNPKRLDIGQYQPKFKTTIAHKIEYAKKLLSKGFNKI